MRADETCTVFNRVTDPDTRLERWQRCEIRGVCWQGGGAVTDRKMARSGNVMIYIPFSARADGEYAPPRAFAAEPGGKWTLREGDLVARGAVAAPDASLRGLLESGDGVSTIVSVGENAFGSAALRHWEVCAR